MLILNFSHPLTDKQRGQIETLAGTVISNVQTLPVQINQAEPLEQQIREIVNAVQLTSEQWQTQPLLVNLPGYAHAAVVLLAVLHGRIGHFPTLIRLRPQAGLVIAYEVVELLNLQAIRETSRACR